MRLWQLLIDRIPARQALWLVFLVCALPIHIWSWLVFLYKLPSFLLSLNLVQTLGVFAYLQLFALLETVLLWGLIVGLAILLPAKVWRDRFVSQSTVIVASVTLWAVLVQNQARVIENQAESGSNTWILLWTFGCLAALIIFSIIIARWPKVEHLVLAFADRTTVLASFFLIVDLLGVLIVISRNLFTFIT